MQALAAARGRAIRTAFSRTVHSALTPTSTLTTGVVMLDEPEETVAVEPTTNITTNSASASKPATVGGNQAREVTGGRRKGREDGRPA